MCSRISNFGAAFDLPRQLYTPTTRRCPAPPLVAERSSILPFDGRKLGADFHRLRPPRREFMILGGMMVGKTDIEPLLHPFRSSRNFRTALQLLARHTLDRLRFRRGTRLVMGNALAARLFDDVRRTGVDLRFETALQRLILEDARVTGAVFKGREGTFSIRARKGVVLAAGGVGWSTELRERLLPNSANFLACADFEHW